MKLQFSKMHGLGNDFVVLNGIHQRIALTPGDIRHLADRHRGIGCDQVLLVEAPTRPDTDFRYRIFNADGGEVEQCGNGARCFVRFVHDTGLTRKNEIRVETMRGVIVPRLETDGQITVDMGQPRFQPDQIPFQAETEALVYPLQLPDGKTVEVAVTSMGNPHATLIVEILDMTPVAAWGTIIESHPRFPARVNVGFMEITDANHVRLRVFERGSGETLACGTGACAAVVAGIRRGLLNAHVVASMPGGDLAITWKGAGHSVWMTGPATTVFTGEIELPLAGLPSETRGETSHE